MMTAIHNLRAVRQSCADGQPLDPDLAGWLAESLEAFLNRRCDSLEGAFGLLAPQGGVPWWLEDGIRRRNDAIRDLAHMVAPGQSLSAQARQVRQLSVRYAASAWRYDRQLDEMPTDYIDTIKDPLWRAFKSGAAMPVSERHLRAVLAP